VTEWEPATDAEVAMRDALRTDDQESYFRILAGVDLLCPSRPTRWPAWRPWLGHVEHRRAHHVLAFTSPSALQACLADYTGSARRVAYSELAETWPNLEWWLAVNPGLPIEGYLPAWFVAQLSRGDLRLPTRGPGRGCSTTRRLRRTSQAANAAMAAAPGRPMPRTAYGQPAGLAPTAAAVGFRAIRLAPPAASAYGRGRRTAIVRRALTPRAACRSRPTSARRPRPAQRRPGRRRLRGAGSRGAPGCVRRRPPRRAASADARLRRLLPGWPAAPAPSRRRASGRRPPPAALLAGLLRPGCGGRSRLGRAGMTDRRLVRVGRRLRHPGVRRTGAYRPPDSRAVRRPSGQSGGSTPTPGWGGVRLRAVLPAGVCGTAGRCRPVRRWRRRRPAPPHRRPDRSGRRRRRGAAPTSPCRPAARCLAGQVTPPQSVPRRWRRPPSTGRRARRHSPSLSRRPARSCRRSCPGRPVAAAPPIGSTVVPPASVRPSVPRAEPPVA
jgi:hypothetical protein